MSKSSVPHGVLCIKGHCVGQHSFTLEGKNQRPEADSRLVLNCLKDVQRPSNAHVSIVGQEVNMNRSNRNRLLLGLALFLTLTACPGPTTNPAQWDVSNFDQATWQ